MQENTFSNEVEFPFGKEIVFKSLVKVVTTMKELTIQSSNELVGRMVVNSKTSIFTFGESIVITLSEPAPKKTFLRTSRDSSGGGNKLIKAYLQPSSKVGDTLQSAKSREIAEKIIKLLSDDLAKLKSTMPSEDKTCPFCAETIKIQAIKCRFCGADLPPPMLPPQIQPSQKPVDPFAMTSAPKFLRQENGAIHFECGYCTQPIEIDASGGGVEIKCPECGEPQKVPTA